MPQKNQTPLSLQVLVHARDNYQALKPTTHEWAMLALFATCGKGQNVTMSMVNIAKTLGMSRPTAIKAKNGLVSKGMVEDLGEISAKSQIHRYRLTVPGQGVKEVDVAVKHVDTPVKEVDTPCQPGEHNIKTEIEKEIENDINISPGEARDDGVVASLSSQSQNQAPAGPHPAGADSGVDLTVRRTGWDDPDEGGWLADTLGVPFSSIGKSFRAWFDGLIRSGDLDMDMDFPALHQAAQDSAGKRNPVGYFQTILPGRLVQARAERDQQTRQLVAVPGTPEPEPVAGHVFPAWADPDTGDVYHAADGDYYAPRGGWVPRWLTDDEAAATEFADDDDHSREMDEPCHEYVNEEFTGRVIAWNYYSSPMPYAENVKWKNNFLHGVSQSR